MKNNKVVHAINAYFNFTKRERNGILVLLIFIGILFIVPKLYVQWHSSSPIQDKQFKEEIAALELLEKDSNTAYTYIKDDDQNNATIKTSNQLGTLFYFNPNTASIADWQRLGIRDKTIQTIQRYLSKGGKFKTPNDIKKIWGIPPQIAEKLIPYIQIPESSATSNFNLSTTPKHFTPKSIPIININFADTTQWIALPGIGAKLSNRIVAFREKLGGFYNIAQVAETYGLPDSTFQKILPFLKLPNPTIKRININKATVDELKVHPYIRFNIAQAIIQYRNQHGAFNQITDLQKNHAISVEQFQKMSPYLTVDD
ncbi:MAG: helix-hairpin-helix domain-containing protein [Ferruginibacter sp.]